jgi:hypothetical protein
VNLAHPLNYLVDVAGLFDRATTSALGAGKAIVMASSSTARAALGVHFSRHRNSFLCVTPP